MSERVLPRASKTNVSVKVRRRDREERTKTLETKKRGKFFGCDEESVMEESARKRKWKRKRRRGKQKTFVKQERAGERRVRERSNKISMKVATVNFQI
jgi:hypothetical protein